jgi:hypothetical protein
LGAEANATHATATAAATTKRLMSRVRYFITITLLNKLGSQTRLPFPAQSTSFVSDKPGRVAQMVQCFASLQNVMVVTLANDGS